MDDILVDAVAAGRGRVQVWAPPRHGKSYLTSHYFPAWFLLNFPAKRVILASYQADFAAQWGRKVRDTVTKWGPLFGVRVRQDSKAADRWDIIGYGGGMQTAGAGGAILGKGADLLILDDLIKNSEEALSEVTRQKVWDWLVTTAMTRLEPGATVVNTMQRWHTQDPGGRLVAEQPGVWTVLTVTALAEPGDPFGREPGEALWPERYDRAYLEELRASNSRWFGAQYQQKPLDLEGGFFRGLEKIRLYDVAPTPDQFTRRCRFWDLASTEAQAGADPDWTAGVLIGKHRDGTFWVLDVIRARLGPKGVRQLIRQTAESDGLAVPIRIEREGGASGKMVVHALITEELSGWSAGAVTPKGSKAERAEPWGSQIEAGNVCIVKNAVTAAFLDEHRGFPLGAHDDMVDAVSGAFAEVSRPPVFVAC